VGIGRTGDGRRAVARLDIAFNRHHPPPPVPLRQPWQTHDPGRAPVNFSPWISRQGSIGLWPIAGPDPDGKINAWHVSARRACNELMRRWGQVRTEGRGGSGGYIVEAARVAYPDPVWPENVDLDRMLELAFEDRDLDSLDHPIAQKLLGTA
jgi:hypothetical protein